MLKLKHINYAWQLMLLLSMPLFSTAQEQLFKNGDRVCFVGNSITQAGEFHHQIALFYATRFPAQKISFYNNGIGGNSSGDIIKRMSYDVLNCQPTWSVVKLGMNDVNRELYTPGLVVDTALVKKRERMFSIYKTNLQRIIDTLLAHKSKVILQTPTIYDQTADIPAVNYKGRNDALDQYSDFVKQLGKSYHLPVVDYHTILAKVNRQLQAQNPHATIIGPDRVHPGPPGHFVMAWQFLKSTGMPQYVAAINIDAHTGAIKTNNAAIAAKAIKKTGVSFNYMANALPFPIADNVAPGVALVPFMHDLNQELLCVKHLQAGNYKLSIDHIIIGSFSADSLAQGVNLALIKNTPQYVQALKVLSLYQNYWKTEGDLRGIMSMEYNVLRLRKAVNLIQARQEYASALAGSVTDSTAHRTLLNLQASYLKSKSEEPALKARLNEIRNAIYIANKPVKHVFAISRM